MLLNIVPQVVGFEDEEKNSILKVIATVLHLGNIEFAGTYRVIREQSLMFIFIPLFIACCSWSDLFFLIASFLLRHHRGKRQCMLSDKAK
jgi:hypothetical protein